MYRTTETPGERWRREHPGWPDQCCNKDVCGHRRFINGLWHVRCESPAACEFRVPDAQSDIETNPPATAPDGREGGAK